jgi:hypothetical protein
MYLQYRKRFRHVLLDLEDIPTEDEILGIFFGARLIAMQMEKRPDYERLQKGRKHAGFYARTYKDHCYSAINSYLRKAPLQQLSRTVATLMPQLTDAGFDAVSDALTKEFGELLDLIVYEKKEFFWLYNKYFQKGLDKWT